MKLFHLKELLFFLFLPFFGLAISTTESMDEYNIVKIKAMNYKELWKKVDSLNQNGLYREAYTKVELIYRQAKEDKETEQLIKALFYVVKYLNELEIEGKILGIKRLEMELKVVGFPENALLHSILAELYAEYLNENAWSLMDRKEIEGSLPDDLNLWSIRNFEEAISNHYFNSIAFPEAKNLELKKLDGLIRNPEKDDFVFHSLFDLLVYRATTYFSNHSSRLIKPDDSFIFNDPLALAPLDSFISADFTTSDSSSFIKKTISLYQDILNFHRYDKDPAVLIDFEMQRMIFANQHLTLEHKNELYLKQLNHLINKYPDHLKTAEIYYLLASEMFQQSLLVKAVSLCRLAIQKYSKSYGSSLCQQLLNRIEGKNLALTLEDYNLPDRTILLKISFKNVKSFKGGVVPISYSEFLQSRLLDNEKDIKKFLKDKKAIKNIEVSLPDSLDYLQHETEIAIDGLKQGTYIFLFEGEDMLPSFIPFQISKIGYFIKNEGAEKMEFQFFNKETSLPLAGTSVLPMPVRPGYFSANVPQISFKDSWKWCDENGFLSYSLPMGSFDFKIANGDDTILIEDHFFISEKYKNEVNLQLKTSIFSDRKIYRPGQTVYWKAILMEKEGNEKAKISSNKEVSISLNDPNGMLLSQMTLISNGLGSVNGSFIIPSDIIKGNYTLVSSHGGIRENIQVEEYKRPQFEIKFEKSPVGVLGDSLEILGFTQFFNGLAIENAKVKWEITRKSMSDIWRPSNRFQASDASNFLSSGETLTDDKGLFRLPFLAAPDLSINPDKQPAFQFIVKVFITAPSGEIQEKMLSFNMGYAKANLNLEIPESWDKQLGNLDWSMFLSDWNGDQMNGAVNVSVLKLKSPRQNFVDRKWTFPDRPLLSKDDYIRLFPYLPFQGEENISNLDILNILSEENIQIKGEKRMEIPFETMTLGYYLIKIIVPDGIYNGKDKIINKFIYLFDSNEKRISTPKWVDIHLKKDILKTKDTLEFKIAAAEEIKKVLVLFTTRNNNYKEWVNIDDKSEIKIPIQENEEGPGNLEVFAYFQNEPIYINKTVKIIYPVEKLNVTYHRFKDLVTPGELVQWEVNISPANGDIRMVEALATMFDASLETFIPHKWSLNSFQVNNYLPSNWIITNPHLLSMIAQPAKRGDKWKEYSKYYPVLNDFDFIRDNIYLRSLNKRQMAMSPPSVQAFKESASMVFLNNELDELGSDEENALSANIENETVVRSDLSETVFFQPTLLADEKGDLKISFKMKDALTRWKFMLFAHQSDLNYAFSEKFIVSRLPVMIQSNAPRFLREGDELKYAVILTNTTEENVSGKLSFTASDGLNGIDLTKKISLNEASLEIVVPAGKSIPVLLPLKIPSDGSLKSLELLLKFESANYTDAMKEWLPILPSQILVTESRPFILREKQKISFKLSNDNAPKEGENTFDLQLTSNPAWIALKSLPYLMEYPYDCNEQLFNKLYANVLGTHLLTQYPTISKVLDEWKKTGSLVSELEKNESLKSALLKESPWLTDARNEGEQRQYIARLLDLPRMTKEVNETSKILSERQSSDGSWGWFPGGRGNWYITQYILSGWGKLKKLGLLDQNNKADLLKNASQYCDEQMIQSYNERIKNKEEEFLPEIIVHYLYTQSFFNERVLSSKVKVAMAYFNGLAKKNWLKMSVFQQGQLAIFWYRSGDLAMAEMVINSLNDRAIKSQEQGMFWKLKNGHHWYENQVETQSLLVEAFSETGFKSDFVGEMKWALIQNKRTTHWETTKSTADAIYALLGGGSEKMVQREQYPVRVTFSDDTKGGLNESLSKALKNSEAATGSIHQRWSKTEIADNKGEIKIENNQSGIIWGAATWQFFKEINEIREFNSPYLSVSRSLFVKKTNKSGEILSPIGIGNKLNIGDRLIIRLTIKSDRDMEYVHLNDKRAAGIEPEKVLSGYVFNGGLYYYESSSDLGTDFFIDYLPKGTYTIDYPVKVNAEGTFSLGTSTIQCMYAPEFGSHTKGEKIYIVK